MDNQDVMRRIAEAEEKVNRLIESVETLEGVVKNLEAQVDGMRKLAHEEAMAVMGLSFTNIGQQMVAQALTHHKYRVIACDENNTVNPETFFARRHASGMLVHTMVRDAAGNEQARPINVSLLPETMSKAITDFLEAIPEECPALAFNVYRAEE